MPRLLSLLLFLSFGAPLFAQVETLEELADPESPKPILIINQGSIERVLTEVGSMFEVAGRPDMNEVIAGFLGNQLGDLKGIDRTRPIGTMVFLTNDLPPRPAPMFFLPVDNLDDLLKTAELGPIKPKRVEGSDNRFEFSGRRRGAMHGLVQDDYAFITRNESLLDAELPDPKQLTAGLAAKYDLSLSIQIQNIAPGIRDLFITLMRSNAEAQLQQRDDESEASHKLRRANGLNLLDLGEQLLRDGKQLTLGLDSSHDGHQAVVELNIEAEPESEFSRFMKNISGKTTHFEPLLSEYAPLSLSLSWQTDERERKALNGNIDALEAVMLERLDETAHAPAGKMIEALRSTVKQEHIDAIFQFIPQEDRKFVLVGGLKMMGSASFGAALPQVLNAVGQLEGIDSMDLNIDEHQSVILHRLRGKNASPEDKRIYGGHPDVYLGAGNGIFWIGLGGDAVINELNAATDLLLETKPELRPGSTAPFQLIFRMLPWLDLPERENAGPFEREIAGDAMASGQDGFRIEVRPSENGGIIRAQFDEGFVHLIGLVLATQYDRSQL